MQTRFHFYICHHCYSFCFTAKKNSTSFSRLKKQSSAMPRSTKCPVCGEEYSVLRSSTDCALCHRTACSSCCRPSPLNPSSKICISCARKQQKVDDSNDDRPKWLREAQALRQNQPGSSTDSFPHKSNPSTNPSFSSGAKKSHAMDDRPKWLREAQEQRASASSTVASHSSPPDQAIESRLAKLKGELNEMKPIATDDELTDRMARLRDQDPKGTSTKCFLPQSKFFCSID